MPWDLSKKVWILNREVWNLSRGFGGYHQLCLLEFSRNITTALIILHLLLSRWKLAIHITYVCYVWSVRKVRTSSKEAYLGSQSSPTGWLICSWTKFMHDYGRTELAEDQCGGPCSATCLAWIDPYSLTHCFMVAWGEWHIDRKIDKISTQNQFFTNKFFQWFSL